MYVPGRSLSFSRSMLLSDMVCSVATCAFRSTEDVFFSFAPLPLNAQNKLYATLWAQTCEPYTDREQDLPAYV